MAIKRLQRRFIMIATIAVLTILAVITILINSLFYRTSDLQIDAILSVISANHGFVSEDDFDESDGDRDSWFSLDTMSDLLRGILFSTEESTGLSREDAFAIRYFTLYLDEDGQITDQYLDRIALVTYDELDEILVKTLDDNEERGRIEMEYGVYDFQLTEQPSGRMIVYLDTTSYMKNEREVLHLTLMISGFCLILFEIIIILLSRKAVETEVRTMEAQKQFITNAGHELKTPLAIISANAELLEMMNGENEWTQSIRHQAKRLTGLVGDLITMSKVGEQQDIILTDTEISSVITEAAEDYRPVIENQKKSLILDIVPDLHLVSEAHLIREIVNILVDNASKYCDEEGRIVVKLEKRGRSGAKLSVTNTYEEGASVDYSMFFDRFYRQDKSHSNEKEGYGIGLSMAQTITEQLKGKIDASYNDGDITFTCFYKIK